MLVSDPTFPSVSSAPGGRADDARLREVARELEASFLAVMLKSAGSGAARDALGGGVGEDQFSSFLTAQHARALVDRGGLGLAESLFQALKARSGNA
jgi:Rod binding domain-containing protein